MSLFSKLQSLLTAANAKTGVSDTTLTAAVSRLIAGYGGGGEGGNANVVTGTVETTYASGATRGITVPVEGISSASHFIFMLRLAKTNDGTQEYDPPKIGTSYICTIGAIVSNENITPELFINNSDAEVTNVNAKYYYCNAAGSSTYFGSLTNHVTDSTRYATVNNDNTISMNADSRFGLIDQTWTYEYTCVMW